MSATAMAAPPRRRLLVQPGGPGAQQLPYLLALPADAGAHTPLWVSVHGLTRQALAHARAFYRPAQAAGAALLVPLFSTEQHRRYQRLVHPSSGRRADLALLRTVRKVRQRHGLADTPFHLFGYSAGAQFAHRFAMAHPQRLASVALGAAGWYTLPDETLPYPMGQAGMAESLALPPLDRAAFLALPTALWVGERDNQPDNALRRSVELDRLQGPHRLARARRWAEAVTAARLAGRTAPAQGPLQVPVHLVPRAGHDFSACAQRGRLAWQVAAFFNGQAMADAGNGAAGGTSNARLDVEDPRALNVW